MKTVWFLYGLILPMLGLKLMIFEPYKLLNIFNMKKITLLIALITFAFTKGQTTSSPVYDGTFNGTVYSQTFNFPTGAESYAGFANNNSEIYPLSFTNGGKIKFKATVAADAEVYFRFEANPYPDVDPAYNTANISLLASNSANTEYIVDIPAGSDSYNSAIFYVVTRDVDVSITETKIETYDTDGTTILSTDFPVYEGTFNGTVYTQTFNFPTGAESYAGFANNNTDVYPISFSNGGKVKFKATVTTDAEVYFRFEANAYPDVDPAYNTANISLLASNDANTEYVVDIPSTTNTYNSTIFYLVTRDIDVNISNIKIIGNGTSEDPAPTDAPATPPTFSDASNVISIFSDAYTAATTFSNVSWDDSAFEEVVIGGNNVLKITGVNFLGMDLGAYLDATNMTHLHMDYWIVDDWQSDQVLNPKLSNHAAEAGETSAIDITNTIGSQAEVQNWQSKDFVLNGDRESIKEFLITVSGKTDVYYLDNVYMYVEGTAGIENNNLFESKVYPNPTSDTWTISTQNNLITSVEVFNLLGKRVVSQKSNNSTEASISTQGLTSGIYIAKITTEQGTKSVKLIKE